MRLGFGPYRHTLDQAYCEFAAQCDASDVVVHLGNYFNQIKQRSSD